MCWPAPRSNIDILRILVIGAGLCWSIAFGVVALHYELQHYADGAIFSYAIAVQDVWAFHWHNISSRVSVFFLTLWPAELYVGLTGDPRNGIRLYGFLFYIAPVLALIGTFAADRSRRRSYSPMPAVRPPCSARWFSAFRPRCGWRMRCSGRHSPFANTRAAAPAERLWCLS